MYHKHPQTLFCGNFPGSWISYSTHFTLTHSAPCSGPGCQQPASKQSLFNSPAIKVGRILLVLLSARGKPCEEQLSPPASVFWQALCSRQHLKTLTRWGWLHNPLPTSKGVFTSTTSFYALLFIFPAHSHISRKVIPFLSSFLWIRNMEMYLRKDKKGKSSSLDFVGGSLQQYSCATGCSEYSHTHMKSLSFILIPNSTL